MKMNKKMMFGMMALCLVGMVSAVWFMNYEGFAVVQVTSTSDIIFVDGFAPVVVDVSSAPASDVQIVEIQNSNGERYYNAFSSTEITDVEGDGCDDYLSDTTVSMTQNGGSPLGEGAVLVVKSAQSTFVEIRTDVVEDACPVTINTTLSLIPQ